MPEEKVSRSWRTDMLGNDAPAADAGPRQPDKLESEEFYDLMQQYRHAPATQQYRVIKAFEAVKEFVRHEPAAATVPHEPSETLKQIAAPKQWKRGASGHYAEHLSTHTNPPEECSACKVIEAQMTVNNLPQGAVGVPQEAAPIFNTHESLTVPIGATAPDWAMRVAREIVPSVHENYAFDDTLPEREAVYAHVAALIREAGSERERELRGALKDALADYFESHLGARLDAETDDEWKPDWYIKASRLLGGESNG